MAHQAMPAIDVVTQAANSMSTRASKAERVNPQLANRIPTASQADRRSPSSRRPRANVTTAVLHAPTADGRRTARVRPPERAHRGRSEPVIEGRLGGEHPLPAWQHPVPAGDELADDEPLARLATRRDGRPHLQDRDQRGEQQGEQGEIAGAHRARSSIPVRTVEAGVVEARGDAASARRRGRLSSQRPAGSRPCATCHACR